MLDEVIEAEVSTSDIQNDAPTTTEEAKVEVEKQEPETVTLTKAELDEQKNAVAAKERARAERKSERAIQAMKAEFDAKFESLNEKPKVAEGEPKLEDYETYDQFVRASARWEVKEELKADRQKVKVEQENQSRASLMKEHEAREAKARESMPDYDAVTGNLSDAGFDINPEIGRAIVSSDLSPELIYYFGKDLDELERINNLSPMAAAREIGKIEAKLLAKPIKTSSAPNPITPVGQTKGTVTTDPAKMTDAEWYAQQQKEKQRNKGN